VNVDLNADLGELGADHDRPLIESITSASIAAGFHAGTPSVLRATIRLAKAHNVAIGAHPSFDDRAGFGRREIHLPPAEVESLVLYQVAAVAGVARAEGMRLQHVKPHGALYNMAARDHDLASAIVCAVATCDPSLILFAPPGSELYRAGRAVGLRVAAEVFADRAYRSDRTLAPRETPGAVLGDPGSVLARAVDMLASRSVATIDGGRIPIEADTICVHGDTAGAAALAATLRAGLEAAGITVKPFR